jgi:hypothetical protein
MADIRFPFGAIDVQNPTYAASITATISKSTFITVGSAALAAGFTLVLALGAGLVAGDMLFVSWLSDGTARSMTPSTGFKGTTAIAGTISKTQTAAFVFDGTVFQSIGNQVQ